MIIRMQIFFFSSHFLETKLTFLFVRKKYIFQPGPFFIASSRKHKISAEKKHKSFARRPHIFTMVWGIVLYSQDIYTQSVQKKAEYSEDGIQLKYDEDDDAKEISLSLSPFISKIVETQLRSRTPEKLFLAMPA